MQPPQPQAYDTGSSRRSSTSTNASTRTKRSVAPGSTTKEPRSKKKRKEETSDATNEAEVLHPPGPSHIPDLSALDKVQAQYSEIKAQLDSISKVVQSNPHAPEHDSSLVVDPFMKQLLEGIKETHDLLRTSNAFHTSRRSSKRKREGGDSGGDGDANDGDDEGGGGNRGGAPGVDDDDEEEEEGMDIDQDGVGLPKVLSTKPASRGNGANEVANEVRKIFNAKFKGHRFNPEVEGDPDVENMVLDLTKNLDRVGTKL
ncbi:hypothetical protein NMY22_g20278 [Coprinellus aureogranulatus]|nr:hypothetical protein NMY22_g20278 [Coprinellus aureogranulatus]